MVPPPTAGTESEGNCCPFCRRDTGGPFWPKWTDWFTLPGENWTSKSSSAYDLAHGLNEAPAPDGARRGDPRAHRRRGGGAHLRVGGGHHQPRRHHGRDRD